MADAVRGIDYYYVTVPDAPGEGERILSALKDGGVNLLAFLGFPLGGGQCRLASSRKTRIGFLAHKSRRIPGAGKRP
jgi:hypothetical protein